MPTTSDEECHSLDEQGRHQLINSEVTIPLLFWILISYKSPTFHDLFFLFFWSGERQIQMFQSVPATRVKKRYGILKDEKQGQQLVASLLTLSTDFLTKFSCLLTHLMFMKINKMDYPPSLKEYT